MKKKQISSGKILLVISIILLIASLLLMFFSIKESYSRNNKDNNVYEKLAALFGLKYTIIFDSAGGTSVPSQKVRLFSRVKKPSTIMKKGYKFVAWKFKNMKFKFNTRITRNMTLTATWKPHKFECKSVNKKFEVCVDRYVLPYKNQLQNFAISDKYVYFSAPLYGAWSDGFNSLEALRKNKVAFNQIFDGDKPRSNSHIVRLDKDDFSNYLITELKWSGHGQNFDVNMEDGKDKIFFNNAAYQYIQKMNGRYYYGARSRGIAITNLSENSYKEENVKATKIVKKIPGKTIFINENAKQIDKLLSQDYKDNINDYYNSLRSLGTNSNYLDGDIAVNENKLAANIGGKVRVYDLKSLRENYKYKKLVEYGSLATESQGIALSGKENEVLKLYQDKNNAIIERYNSNFITTEKKIETDVASVNLSSYYGSNKFEVEGIKVYQEDGTYYVYLGVARINVSPRQSDIIRIKYDDLVFNRKSRSI